MRTFFFIAMATILQASSPFERSGAVSSTVCLTAEEEKLYDLMMSYRQSKGLQPIALSEKLTMVAQTHARDLAENYAFDPKGRCNPHSWSRKGKWSPCCY